jgi:hypothetical protein
MFLGKDLLPLLLLALGGALCVGNVLAVIRPPAKRHEGDLTKAPLRRSVLMGTIGFLVALWALASLFR